MTYNEIATREDIAHINKAKRHLGERRFNQLTEKARSVFIEAWNNEPSEIKKPNKAKQAVNLMFTHEMNNKA